MDAQESFSYFAPYLWGIWGFRQLPGRMLSKMNCPTGGELWGNGEMPIFIFISEADQSISTPKHHVRENLAGLLD